MKRCSHCKKNKAFIEFGKNRSEKNGLQNFCKLCDRSYHKEWFLRNKEVQRKRVAKNNLRATTRNRLLLWEYLNDKQCVDCGIKDPVVLQFDHVRGIKRNAVSILVCRGWSWNTILNEINKCEIRCANCHTIKTAERAQTARHKHYNITEDSFNG